MAIYVCSDLHGMRSLYDQINDFLGENDKVIFLGDAADRGKDGWSMIKSIYYNPKWIYIKGNHEEMLATAMRQYNAGFIFGMDIQHLYDNGGFNTLHDWIDDFHSPLWAENLENLPIIYEVTNAAGKKFICCHAGLDPWDIDYINEDDRIIWDRSHYFSKTYIQENYSDFFVIHGHTPARYMIKDILNYQPERATEFEGWTEDKGALIYCGGHKINMDMQSAFTGKCALLNIDTMESKVFTCEAEK